MTMLSFKEAQETLKYYGFKSKNIEPILVEKNGKVGIFSTFKTKYGHLSRFITFEDKEKIEKFLKEYIKYQKSIDNEDTLVTFSDYENLSPTIKFDIVDKINISENVEELEINTTDEDNMSLLNILLDEIKKEIKIIEKKQNDLQDIAKEYLDKLVDLNKKLGKNNDEVSANINLTDINAYTDEVDNIRKNTLIDDNERFIDNFDKALNLYERVLLDTTYIDNIYLTECYKEELRRIKEMLKYYYIYSLNRNKIFKRIKNQTFEEFLMENPIEDNIIDQDELFKKKRAEATNKINKFKNSSIDDLKKMYNVNKSTASEEILGDYKFDFKELNRYFKTLSDKDKTKIMLISSPLKELVVILKAMDLNKLDDALKEKKFINRFKEMYNIISNEDNYSIVRKVFPKLNLDSVEEFIYSLIDYSENLDINSLKLGENTEIRFKMGTPIKKGYINGSLKDSYPINNKGANTYYIVNSKIKLPIYFSNKLLLLKADGTIELVKNEDIITFKMDNVKLTNKKEVKVKDYIYKKNDFVLFNEKKYINCEMENGDR